MKKLKKVLSLVLVVAMLASMLIVGAAAAEAEEIQYDEAVTVMTGIGVIEGDEGGIRPTDTVTREEAAKIIAYIVLGADTAETLKTTTAPFADVAANRWSAGYIAYLKNQGVISGVTDTTFDPTADVTGIAFAKMMLVALGFGQAGEFEGDAWDINTITFARDNDIFEGTKAADLTAPATREECMLYGFNALTKAPTVNYNKTFESYYVGPHALAPVDGDIVDFDNSDPVYVHTLAWKNYELQQVATNPDQFGRPAVTWNADGVDVADTVVNKAPNAVLYGSVNAGALYNALGKTVAEAINKDDDWSEISIAIDGAANAYTITSPLKAGYTTEKFATNGATTEIYVDYANGVYDVDIVVWYEYIGTVTKVSKVNNSVTIDTAEYTVAGEEVDITGITKKDVVIYTQGKDSVASVRVAEPVVGTLVNTTLFTYNIDGVTVYASNHVVSEPDTYGASYEIYYDAQGNILMATEYDTDAATGTYQYLYLKALDSLYKSESLINNTESVIALEVIYANGGKATVNYEIKEKADGTEYITLDGVKYNLAKGSAKTEGGYSVAWHGHEDLYNGVGSWFSYKVNEAGEVTLRSLTNNNFATPETAIDVETGKASTGTAFAANSQTVLTVVNEDGIALTYTGIANFPEEGEIDGSYPVLVTHGKDSTLAKSIVVYMGGSSIASAKDYAYVVMAWSYDDDVVTYMAYMDGSMQFITTEYTPNSEYVMYTVCEINTVDGETVVSPVSGAINHGKYQYDPNTSIQLWYEEATIDTVDENFFTTVEVDVDGYDVAAQAVADATTAFNSAKTALAADPTNDTLKQNVADAEAALELAQDELAELMADTTGKVNVASKLYYYNEDTVIYDCVNGGIVTELNPGDCFMAIANAKDATLCDYIFIVG